METDSQAKIHFYFRLSLLLKCIFAVFEVIAGSLMYFLTFFGGVLTHFSVQQTIWNFVTLVLSEELTEDPHDLLANYVLQLPHGIPIEGVHFAALYLLSHGIVKLVLIMGLYTEKIRYYPIAMMVFGAFIVYQLFRYTHTHSVILLGITAIDLAVIWLTWKEYQHLKYNFIHQ